MRIWDIPVSNLCRKHLLGEHRELHAIWSILTKNKVGYKNHPETKRWIGKLAALYQRHQKEVDEMRKRGFKHQSPLEKKLATGSNQQHDFVDSPKQQTKILKYKKCNCNL